MPARLMIRIVFGNCLVLHLSIQICKTNRETVTPSTKTYFQILLKTFLILSLLFSLTSMGKNIHGLFPVFYRQDPIRPGI